MTISTLLLQLAEGMQTSILIFALTLLISLPLGLLVSFGRMSKNFLIRNLVKIYISIMRGTPLMLQIMFVYFSPFFIFSMEVPKNYRFMAVIISFGLNYAAYFAEIYRSGIESMPVGQYEASQLLGYSKIQTFFRIILPQVFKRIVPAITNEVITLVKDTSLAFVISVTEMFTKAKAIASAQQSMTPFIAAALFYYIFNFLVAMIMERIEAKLNYYR